MTYLSKTSLRHISTAIIGLLLLSSCSTIQTTSGRDYMARYAAQADAAGVARIEDDIRQAASVEPLLQFPARIGVARIKGGQLSSTPAEESQAWARFAEDIGPEFGELVPVSRLVAELAYQPRAGDQYNSRGVAETVRLIRLGAARQHLDAVLIYEVYGTQESTKNALSIADLTIIGAFFVPSRKVEVVGYADAILIDVRNGYPYGTVRAEAGKSALSAAVGDRAKGRDMVADAETAATVALTQKIAPMFARLASQLENKTAGQTAPEKP